MKIEEFNVDVYYKGSSEVLTEKQKKRGVLIYAFQQIQKEYNYLPKDKLRELSKELDIPLAEIYSTASFYKQFYFKPRGKNIVCVCIGTACHIKGAPQVLEELKNEFGIKEGETTEDLLMTLETVGCVGCCGVAPVVTVNEKVVGNVDSEKINEIIKNVRGEAEA